MGVPAIALGVVALGADLAGMYENYQAEESKQKQIDEQQKLTRLEYVQRTLNNYDTMEKLLDSQTAAASARGVAMTSPSLNAIQRNTYNVGARANENLKIEESISEQNARVEKENVRNAFYGNVFTGVADAAKKSYDFYKSSP